MALIDYAIDPQKQTVQGQLDTILSKDSPLMQKAKASGNQYANSRGLINSSMAAGAAQSAMMDYAMPIASQDAGTYNNFASQKYGAELQDQINTGQLAKSTTANLQGSYLKSIDEITNNAMVSINEIEVAEGIAQSEKDKMIQNTINRRNADLEFTKMLYSNMPTWDFSWVDIDDGGMPEAPGYSG